MNNKVVILVMGMFAVGVGCAQPEDADVACGNKTVTVNHAAAYLKASPEHVRKICPGNTLTVTLVPPVDRAGAARTDPMGKNKEDARWLEGRNSELDRIVLTVPGEKEAIEGEFKYSISIDGIGVLDPRVTVAK